MRCLLSFPGAFLLAQGLLRLAASQNAAAAFSTASGAALLIAGSLARSSSLRESLIGYAIGVGVTLLMLMLYPLS